MANPKDNIVKKKGPNRPTEARLARADYQRNNYLLTVEPGTKIEDILETDFWAHLGHKLRPYDIIEIIPEDGAFYGKLLVIACDRLWAKMRILENHDLSMDRKDMPLTDNQNHLVEWKGPTAKFAVIRRSDSVILKDGFQNPLEGWQWLDGHLKSLAA